MALPTQHERSYHEKRRERQSYLSVSNPGMVVRCSTWEGMGDTCVCITISPGGAEGTILAIVPHWVRNYHITASCESSPHRQRMLRVRCHLALNADIGAHSGRLPADSSRGKIVAKIGRDPKIKNNWQDAKAAEKGSSSRRYIYRADQGHSGFYMIIDLDVKFGTSL